jgi:CheY-like chemotaxis protein
MENDKITFDRQIEIISAEDVEINHKLLERFLANENISIKKVYNGEELLTELELSSYDLILIDIQMPVLNGVETTRIIRENEKFSKIPIIAVSAHAFEEDVQEILDAGANDYVKKPIKKAELIEKIQKWVNLS